MSVKKYQKIVDGLVSKTQNHELEWRETVDRQRFQVSFKNYSVIISKEIWKEGSGIRISILNPEGTEIDSFDDEDLHNEGLDKYSDVMSALYLNARRQALGVDAALDEILNELRP